MADVVLLDGVDPSLAAALADRGLTVEQRASDDLGATVDAEGADPPAVAVAPVAAGVEAAQVVQAHAPATTVLYLAPDHPSATAFGTRLTVTPGIGRHTRCLVAGSGAELAEAVVEEVELARRRAGHRRTMAEVRRSAAPVAAGSPERAGRFVGQIFQHAPIGILIVEHGGVVRAANPAIEEALGWRPGHAVGTELPTMFLGEAAATVRELLAACMTTGQAGTERVSRTGPGGGPQHLELRAAPVDPQHPELGVMVLVRDETQERQAVEEAATDRDRATRAAERYRSVARTLQESLLPPDLPAIRDVALGAAFHPAGDGSEIGGDFYDVFQVADDEWCAVIGDVCGKGAAAARLTALSRYTLRAAAARHPDPATNLADLNDALLRQAEVDRRRGEHRFVTAALLRFRPGAGSVHVRTASGGHLPPLLVRADGAVEEVSCRGSLLGMFDDVRLTTVGLELAPGDALVLVTDGVTEARRQRELFGEERLQRLLAGSAGRPAPELADAIAEAVLAYQQGLARDDLAVLVVQAPPRRRLTVDV